MAVHTTIARRESLMGRSDEASSAPRYAGNSAPRDTVGMDDGSPRRNADQANSDEAAAVQSLLSRAADGDQQAWRDIIGLYGRRVFAMVKSHLRSDELAEEITQSVFVTVAQKLPGSETGGYREQGSFEPWLFRITMNRVRDEARRAKRQARPTDPETIAKAMPASEAASASFEADPQHQELRNALDRLEAADREIIDMRHIGGMSFKQIAAVLDAPIGTVLARHHRALKKLRNTLES